MSNDPREGDMSEREYCRITGIVHLRIAKQQATEALMGWSYYYPAHAATIKQAITLLSAPLDYFDGLADADEEGEDESASEEDQASALARVGALLGQETGAQAAPPDPARR